MTMGYYLCMHIDVFRIQFDLTQSGLVMHVTIGEMDQ